MKFINKSNNTIYLSDIDRNIPFYEDFSPQEIKIDDVKKSKSFRLLLTLGQIKITEIGNSLFENNLLRKQNINKVNFEKVNKEEILEETNTKELSVKLRGHFYEAGGYAKVNRNLAKSLYDLGIKIEIDPVNKTENHLSEEEIRTLSIINTKVDNKCISIDSMIPTLSNMSNGMYRVLYTTVEASSVPQQFIDVANQYHEIWVTSDFCLKILEESGVVRPIYVMPDSIDTDLYVKSKPYKFNPPLKKFVFISVFGWSYRKGYDVLLKSYLEEFSGDDPVSLLIISRMSGNSKRAKSIKDNIEEYVKKYGGDNPPHITRCKTIIPEKIMPNIYSAANAFILPSRGEGFGLIYCESSLCGLPVIATDISGHTMFLKDDNSFLIETDTISEMQSGLMNVHYWDNHLFPQLKAKKVIESAKKQMRFVFENYEEAKDKNKKLQKFINENYNMKTIGTKAKERLEIIWEKIK